jgi:hypothetical protein
MGFWRAESGAHFMGAAMRIGTKLVGWAVVVLGAVALIGCDRPSKLEEGVSTEVEVRKEFGEPVTVTVLPDGSRIMEYPRQPEGWTNYLITIGADGKMSALRQLLNADNFARVKPGLSQTEVRNLLGRPAKATPYALKNEEVWDWRYKPQNESKLFSVTFGPDKRVMATATMDDPRESQGGNRN